MDPKLAETPRTRLMTLKGVNVRGTGEYEMGNQKHNGWRYGKGTHRMSDGHQALTAAALTGVSGGSVSVARSVCGAQPANKLSPSRA